jgi:hypothetical protein
MLNLFEFNNIFNKDLNFISPFNIKPNIKKCYNNDLNNKKGLNGDLIKISLIVRVLILTNKIFLIFFTR